MSIDDKLLALASRRIASTAISGSDRSTVLRNAYAAQTVVAAAWAAHDLWALEFPLALLALIPLALGLGSLTGLRVAQRTTHFPAPTEKDVRERRGTLLLAAGLVSYALLVSSMWAGGLMSFSISMTMSAVYVSICAWTAYLRTAAIPVGIRVGKGRIDPPSLSMDG